MSEKQNLKTTLENYAEGLKSKPLHLSKSEKEESDAFYQHLLAKQATFNPDSITLRQKIWSFSFGLLASSFLLFIFFNYMPSYLNKRTEKRFAQITQQEGTFLWNGENPESSDFFLQKENQFIVSNAFVDLIIAEEIHLRLKKGSYSLTQKNNEWLITILEGELFSLIEKEKTDMIYTVQTRRSRYQLSEGKLQIKSDSKEDYACVCEGVLYAYPFISENSISIKKGQDLYIVEGEPLDVTDGQMMLPMLERIFDDMQAPQHS